MPNNTARSSRGDFPAFPGSAAVDFIDPRTGETDVREGAPGMTYRQWLIGQIAGGMAADPNAALGVPQAAEWCIDFADALIAAGAVP